MMKRLLLSLLALTLCLTAAPEQATAQFWKRKEEKKKPVKKTPGKPATKDAGKKPVAASGKKSKDAQLDYPKTEMKRRYRVDVLTALYLDELVINDKPAYKDRVPEKAAAGLNFYEGIRLAADTLKNYGYQIDVYVHDIANTLTAAETLVNTNSLDSSDLIIGVLNAPQLPTVARYAKQKKINFISALSPSDGGVKDNFYFTMLQPTLQTHCDWIRKDCNSRYGKRKFTAYHRSSMPADENAYKMMIPDVKDGGMEVKCNTQPPQEQLALLFDSSEINVIIMPIMDAAYAEVMLRQLAKDFSGYRFEVYGMPSWKGMNALRKADVLPNITVMLTAPFYFDATTPAGQAIAGSYQHLYGGRPTEMVFRGFETMYWYAYLLDKYGTIFNAKQTDNSKATWTQFEVRPKFTKTDELLYNENQHLFLYRYSSGSYSVEK